MKKVILGIIIGILLMTFTTVYAATQFTAHLATFEVFVNGEKFVSDKPIVVIDGSTYLPLKAIGEVLGVSVKWNSELSRVEVGEEPKKAQTEYGYSNPAPIGTAQTLTTENILQKYTIEMSVNEIIRGDKAWEMIKEANMFNKPAKEGYEYLLAKIYFKVLDVNEGQAYRLSSFNINLISSDGKEYEYSSAVTPEPALDATLYKGASHEGWAVYEVKKDDPEPKLVFGRNYDGSGGIWFKTTK